MRSFYFFFMAVIPLPAQTWVPLTAEYRETVTATKPDGTVVSTLSYSGYFHRMPDGSDLLIKWQLGPSESA